MGERVSTGIKGFDEILKGGFLPRRAYLLRGGPGCGKTTIGLHFLQEGIRRNETCLFITLGETEEQIRFNAATVGLNIDGVKFADLSPSSQFFSQMENYDIFSPAEVEREPVTKQILESIEKHRPQRIFIDSMTQFRYLAPDPFQFRKQSLSFIRFLIEKGATVLFTSEASVEAPDDDLMFLSDGIIHLRFDGKNRFLHISKFRGSDFRSQEHSYNITSEGIRLFPRLVPKTSHADFVPEVLSSGVPEMDELLHGGLERGTVTIFSGPSGVGKTTLAMLFMKEAAGRGERSIVYTFEESVDKIVHRCESVHIPARAMIDGGKLMIERVEPLDFLPDEFAARVRHEIEVNKTSIVMLDSTSGYELAMQGDNPRENLHAICRYMSNMGVAVLLPTEVTKITGEFAVTDHRISYLADNIVFMRYLELYGEMRRAIGVLKKRLSDFEKALREFEITRFGIKVGKPLTNLRNILSGTPVMVD